MNLISDKIYKFKPVYLTEFDDLVKIHAQFGGGASDEKFNRGKSFSNVYEFYVYAFFIGLYSQTRIEILDGDDTKSFWEIENWKPKELTDYLISCAIAESDFDMNQIEQAEAANINNMMKPIKNTIEEYANGGFSYIKSKLDSEPDLIDDDMFFINILSDEY